MASPSELSLECKPQSYSTLLKACGDQADQTQKLEEFLARLEDERLKIDAFKRELPLCMQLLSNALEASRQQLQASRSNQVSRPILEEFIPLKNSASEGTDKASNCVSDKANWMTSAQLWSQASDGTKQLQPPFLNSSSSKEADIGFDVSPKLALDSKQRNGRAFLPFSKERNPNFHNLPELALASSEQEMEDAKYSEIENGGSCPRRENNNMSSCRGGMVIEQAKGVGNSMEGHAVSNGMTNPAAQAHRKARRCWSPDLHRRFVNALQMLGGSQVATPKQIRELMKVDGLTNDEVKSHLQKYRLHTRRPSPSPQSAGAQAPQLVVLGGIWVPPEYAAAAAAHGGGPSLYGGHPSSHPPPHYCTPGIPTQEFYAAAATPPPRPPHHHPVHGQLHVYKTASHTQSSPESGMRVTGDRSESIEDGKSESGSWKGDSGEHGRERKGLSNLRDDNDESNGSEITLKF